jgi:signal transduction histidine kinase
MCLYRVAQEALRNAARHAAAKRAAVTLRVGPDAVRLTVRDDGRGFDVSAARSEGGIGLAIMEERVRLIHGVMSVDSRPGRGTTLRVAIPLDHVNASSPLNAGAA